MAAIRHPDTATAAIVRIPECPNNEYCSISLIPNRTANCMKKEMHISANPMNFKQLIILL